MTKVTRTEPPMRKLTHPADLYDAARNGARRLHRLGCRADTASSPFLAYSAHVVGIDDAYALAVAALAGEAAP